MIIVSVDGGNSGTKTVTPFNVYKYPSNIIGYNTFNVDVKLRDKQDFIFEYADRKGLAGQIAQDESTSMHITRKGESKLHEDALIRVLIALHQFVEDNHVKLIVGQPIIMHKKDKERMQDMFEGSHTITVNDVTRTIHIDEVRVGVEGGSAFYSNVTNELVHLIDIGSGTLNFATYLNKRLVNNKSTSTPLGIENFRGSLEELASTIKSWAINLNWGENERVLIHGGGAVPLYPLLQCEFNNIQVLSPVYNGIEYTPEFANVIGFYRMGEKLWGKM